MRSKKKIAGIVIIGAFLFLICSSASVHAAQMSVVPEYQEVSTGENFTVDIYVDPEGDEVQSGQYWLHFNNTLLNATNQTKGPFLSQDGADTTVYSNVIDNANGRVMYGEARKNVAYGVTTPGVLATITFQAIAEDDGVSELRLDKVKLLDPEVSVIPTNISNGNVSIRIGICGDVNGDGKVNAGDGRRIFMWLGYPDQYPIDNMQAADVNGDGKVNAGDGRRIFMWLGYPDQYPLTCG